jgi:hypothetical protein
MNDETKWILQLAGAIAGLATLIQEGRRRGWL